MEDLAQIAHRLEGSSATLGARRLAALAAGLETTAHEGRLNEARQALVDLATAADAALAAMEDALG
jgi:HPt (histidine-containing phosphotransfer) domain-containing protein